MPYLLTSNLGRLPELNQKGASSDSSQTSALPLEASSTSSSIESLMYSLCANRSHSVKVGFSRSCKHHNISNSKSVTNNRNAVHYMFIRNLPTSNDEKKNCFEYLTNEKWITSFKGHELVKVEKDIENTS